LFEGEVVSPDSIITDGDIGLSILVFKDPLFSDYQMPIYSETLEGELLRIIGQGINGIVIIEESAGQICHDGSVLISASLSDGFMGAAVFNQQDLFLGVISGLEYSTTPNMPEFYSMVDTASETLVLYPTSIWYMWAQLVVNPPESSDGFRFGITAMANTSIGNSNIPPGILLISVEEGGFAWNCGLQPGDIITELNEQAVYHPYTLRGLLLTSEDSLEAVVWNRNNTRMLKIPTAADFD